MAVSRIYRDSAAGDIKEFRFRSFGDSEPLAPAESSGFDSLAAAEPLTPNPAVANHGAPVNLPQLLEEAQARGRQEGLAIAEERFESTSRALAQALEEVSRLRETLAQSGSRDMLRLVMAVSEQIVRRAIDVDPDVVLALVENALQASVRSDSYRISVSPEDLEVVKAQKPLFLASISGLQNLIIDADVAISRGGCRVDSELGDVDATIESQLEAIRQALATAIAEG